MNERATNLSIDELLRHGAFVRALARRLVTDDATADDVVQEVWLRALQHPPAKSGSATGWLASVARNFVRDRSRSEGAREHREERASREKRDPEPLGTEQRSEIVEAIASAFAGLPPAYRDVLYLRYYEDRSPTEIATKLACPLATVKTRLARGIEQLRKALEQRTRERGRSLSSLIAGLVALQENAKPAGVTLAFLGGALSMKKLAAAVVIVCAASWWMWRGLVSGADVAAPLVEPGVEIAVTSGEGSTPEADPPERALMLPAQDTRLLAEPPIRVRVVDEARVALPKVEVELVTERDVVSIGSTDGEGALAIQPLPKDAARLVFSLDGFAVREVPPPKADQKQLEVVLRRGGSIRGRVVEYNVRILPAEQMEPVAGARVVAMGEVRGSAAFHRLQIGDPSIRSAVTDENGEFTIDGLIIGQSYPVRAGARGLMQHVSDPRGASPRPLPVVPASDVLVELKHGHAVAFQFVDDATKAPLSFAQLSVRMSTSCRDPGAAAISAGGIETFLAGLDPRLSDPARGLMVSLACTIEPRAEVGPMNLDATFEGYASTKVEAMSKPLSELTPVMSVALHQTALGFGTVALEWVAGNRGPLEIGPLGIPTGEVELAREDGTRITLAVPLQQGVEHFLRRVPTGTYRASVTANGRAFNYPAKDAPALTIQVEAEKQVLLRVPLDGTGSIELQVERADGKIHDGTIQFQLKRPDARGDGRMLGFSAPPYRILPLDPGTYTLQLVNLGAPRRGGADEPAPVVVAAGEESVVRVRMP